MSTPNKLPALRRGAEDSILGYGLTSCLSVLYPGTVLAPARTGMTHRAGNTHSTPRLGSG